MMKVYNLIRGSQLPSPIGKAFEDFRVYEVSTSAGGNGVPVSKSGQASDHSLGKAAIQSFCLGEV